MASRSHGCRSLVYAAYKNTTASKTREPRSTLRTLVCQQLVDEAVQQIVTCVSGNPVLLEPVRQDHERRTIHMGRIAGLDILPGPRQ
jgi:hypothetical protein